MFKVEEFREQESVTMWVSNDKNKVPLKIQANLAVGSIEVTWKILKI